ALFDVVLSDPGQPVHRPSAAKSMVAAAGAACGSGRRQPRRTRVRSAVERNRSREQGDADTIDKPAAARFGKALAAAACRGAAADAGGIYEPGNKRGAQVLGEHGARACASRDRAAPEVAEKRMSNRKTTDYY